jgi:hypothetical protein
LIFDKVVQEIVASITGDFEIIKDHRGGNERTGVFEIFSNGQRFFVKVHNRLSRWHPEVFAYKNWTKTIEPLAPAMYASFNNGSTFGIITTPIIGRTVNETQITDQSKLIKIYHKAGSLFKRMQKGTKNSFFGIPREDGSPYDKKAITNPEEYISGSIETLFKLGYDNGLFTNSHKPLVEWCLNNCIIFDDEIPTLTNWDFSQNNWMVDDREEFTGFIDFENTLWGLSLDSFGVITERYTFDKPILREAFFEGYGLPKDAVTKEKMRILSVKMALADIYNGYSQNHPRFLECGKRMLSHLIRNYTV